MNLAMIGLLTPVQVLTPDRVWGRHLAGPTAVSMVRRL